MGNISGILATQDSSDIPAMQTGTSQSSGNVPNGAAIASLGAKTGQTAYMTGLQITGAGATAALAVNATVTGLAGGTISYTFVFPAGVAVAGQSIVASFYPGLQASGPNVAITLTLPAGGAGNTNAAVSLQGFYL